MGARPRWSSTLVAMAAIAALLPTAGRAQICGGRPSLREQPLVAGASYTRSDAGWATGGDVTLGRAAFVSLAAGYVRYVDMAFSASRADAHSAVVHLGGGYEAQAKLAGRTTVGICPAGYVEYETGPDGDFGVRLNSNGLTAALGASVGAVLLERGPTRLIPYVGLAYARVSTTVHDFPFAGSDSRATEDGALLDVGVGIAFGTVTVGPEATIPLGFTGADVSYGIGVSLSFGGRHRPATAGR